jgi:hypothetical protein
MTEIADAHAHVQWLVSTWQPSLRIVVPKSSVLLCAFYGQNDPMQRILINKYFLSMVGSICRVKRITTGSRNLEHFSLMRKRLKRRYGNGWGNSQRFLCSGFSHTGKAMEQVYQCLLRIRREMFSSPRFEYHIIYVLYQFVIYLQTLPCISKYYGILDCSGCSWIMVEYL